MLTITQGSYFLLTIVTMVTRKRHSLMLFDGTTLLKLLPVHFRNAPHKHIFTSDALNNRVTTVASSNLYWVYGRG